MPKLTVIIHASLLLAGLTLQQSAAAEQSTPGGWSQGKGPLTTRWTAMVTP